MNFKTDTDAFKDGCRNAEIARILRRAADDIEAAYGFTARERLESVAPVSSDLFDAKGSNIGQFSVR